MLPLAQLTPAQLEYICLHSLALAFFGSMCGGGVRPWQREKRSGGRKKMLEEIPTIFHPLRHDLTSLVLLLLACLLVGCDLSMLLLFFFCVGGVSEGGIERLCDFFSV